MKTRRDLLAGMSAAAFGWMTMRTTAAEPDRVSRGRARPRPPQPGKRCGAEYFSNVTLTPHEGNKVRFYDDLIRGKIVAINMMYAQCAGICPMTTSNLVRLQKLLGERVGRDVYMYSITLLPEQGTPERLQGYGERHGVKPGWLFLTGACADIEDLRYRLGFFDPNPVVDGDKSTHTGMVRIGNDLSERWIMAPALAEPEQIVATINHASCTRRTRGSARLTPASALRCGPDIHAGAYLRHRRPLRGAWCPTNIAFEGTSDPLPPTKQVMVPGRTRKLVRSRIVLPRKLKG